MKESMDWILQLILLVWSVVSVRKCPWTYLCRCRWLRFRCYPSIVQLKTLFSIMRDECPHWLIVIDPPDMMINMIYANMENVEQWVWIYPHLRERERAWYAFVIICLRAVQTIWQCMATLCACEWFQQCKGLSIEEGGVFVMANECGCWITYNAPQCTIYALHSHLWEQWGHTKWFIPLLNTSSIWAQYMKH